MQPTVQGDHSACGVDVPLQKATRLGGHLSGAVGQREALSGGPRGGERLQQNPGWSRRSTELRARGFHGHCQRRIPQT